jgi:hypothetical protein
MQYVYMNERIQMQKPDGAVIVIQRGHHTQETSDVYEIRMFGQPIGRIVFDPKGLKACSTHKVRAWVEFDDDVELIDIRPVAVEKKPRKKVKVSK